MKSSTAGDLIFPQFVMDSSPEAMIITNAEGHIVRVNTRAETLFGYSQDEIAGKNIDRLVSLRGDLKTAKTITETVAAGEKIATETKRRRKNGTLIDVSVLASPIIIDGDQIAVYAIYRDKN